MENSSFKKQAKSDIFKELFPVINFYVRKGAKPNALKKYYKNNKRFNDLLDDIKNKGINLIKDEQEYKKLVREILNDILDDFIAKCKDEDYKKNKESKMKHIKEFYSFEIITEGAKFDFMKHYLFIKQLERKYDLNIFLEKSPVDIFNNCIIEFNNVYRDWDYKSKKPIKFRMKIDECNIDSTFSNKEAIIQRIEEEIDFHKNVRLKDSKTNEELSTFQHVLLSTGAAFCIYKFVKGLLFDILDRNAEKIMSKLDKLALENLSRRIGEKIEKGKKAKLTEDFVYYTIEFDTDLIIRINKQKKLMIWTNAKGQFQSGLPVSQDEIDQLILSLKEENNE